MKEIMSIFFFFFFFLVNLIIICSFLPDYHGIEKWYTQRNPVIPEGVNESEEINLALTRLGYDGCWGDGGSFGTSRSKNRYRRVLYYII